MGHFSPTLWKNGNTTMFLAPSSSVPDPARLAADPLVRYAATPPSGFTVPWKEEWPYTSVFVPEGDSHVFLDDADYDWPTQLQAAMPYLEVVNRGWGGDQMWWILNTGEAQVDPFLHAQSGVPICALWAGSNDFVAGYSAAQVYGWIHDYCGRRQAAGWKVITMTLTPRVEATYPGFEAKRAALNAALVADHHFCDVLIDIAARADIGVAGASTNETYYRVDHLHLNATGEAIVAGLVQTAINGLLAS